jgi:hypothetical protein
MTPYVIKDRETGQIAGIVFADSLAQLMRTVAQFEDPSYYEAKDLHFDQGGMVYFEEGKLPKYTDGLLDQIRENDGWIDLADHSELPEPPA